LYLPNEYNYKKFKGNLEKIEDYFEDLPYEYENLVENTKSMAMEVPRQGNMYLFEDYFINNEDIIIGFDYSKKFKLFKKNEVKPL
jgi:nitrate reductase beta subunit